MLKKTSLIALALNMMIASSAITEENHIYIIPGDAHCVIKKATRKTYCTDNKGNPITGKLNKYKDNTLLRSYELQDGFLNGLSISYDTKERKTSTKTYVDGILDGITTTYYPSGAAESEITYAAGKKDGVAKFYDEAGGLSVQAMYVNNRLNGKMQIYTPKKQLLYNLQNVDNNYVSGIYYYLDNKGEETSTVIPEVVIKALNHKCLEFQTEKTDSACAAVFNPQNTECDEKWRNTNRPAVRKYLADCRKGIVNE